jgi:hypothetical protein
MRLSTFSALRRDREHVESGLIEIMSLIPYVQYRCIYLYIL